MGKLIDGVWVDWVEKVKVLQKAVVKNDDGLFLALKRSKNEKTRPNYWDFCGGSVEQEDIKLDEALKKALAREMFEEANLKLKSSNIIHVSSGFDDKKGVFVVALAYLCMVENENDLKLNEEHSEFKWVTKEELLDLDFGDTNGYYKSIINSLTSY